MNRSLLAGVVCVAAAFSAASCSQAGPTTSSSGASGGSIGSGGTQGVSGTAPGTGGTTTVGSGGASGGTPALSGGSPGTGGTIVGAGGSSTGGTAVAGASTAGGSSSGGAAMGGSSMGGANSGGAAGAGKGGTPAGGAASGGSAGAGTAGSTAITPASIVPTLDGWLWIGTCASGSAAALDCTINDDANQCLNPNAAAYADRGAFRNFTHNVGGTTGQRYSVTFEVRGVAGGRCYTKDANFSGLRTTTVITDVEGPTGNDGWMVGGTPTDSKWNTYEFHVTPPVPGEANVYYLNAFPTTSVLCERHETFVFKYTATFAVLGGGMIKTVIHDSNCLGQQNCGGVDSQPMCASPRTVDLTGMSPQPPSSFMQPLAQAQTHPQWLFFDVKTVTSP